jgi:Fe2+ or Zn2+ uptake regulation protein
MMTQTNPTKISSVKELRKALEKLEENTKVESVYGNLPALYMDGDVLVLDDSGDEEFVQTEVHPIYDN